VSSDAQEQVDERRQPTAGNGQHPPEEMIEVPTGSVQPGEAAPEVQAAAPAPEPANLQVELERLRAEATANLEGWQRERAEFANYRKRSEADRSQLVFLTGVRIVEKLLPVIDDFDRALTSLPDELKDNGWIEGVRLTRRKLVGLLEDEGLSPIPIAPGDPFDPTLHEAITHEASDQFGEGQIIAEVQKGYRIGERVLRPALVRVAR
jgi:molecular chaperone GrpE